jgi:hypothetical protein
LYIDKEEIGKEGCMAELTLLIYLYDDPANDLAMPI